jgi:hypothetical protein
MRKSISTLTTVVLAAAMFAPAAGARVSPYGKGDASSALRAHPYGKGEFRKSVAVVKRGGALS